MLSFVRKMFCVFKSKFIKRNSSLIKQVSLKEQRASNISVVFDHRLFTGFKYQNF